MKGFQRSGFLSVLAFLLLLLGCSDGGGHNHDNNQDLEPTDTVQLTDNLSAEEMGYLTDAEILRVNSLTGKQLNDAGFDQLEGTITSEDMIRAKIYFKLAVSYFGNQASNEADRARFSHGLTQVVALAYDTEAHGTRGTLRAAAYGRQADEAADALTDALRDLGDLLDGFGYPSATIDGIGDPRAPQNMDAVLCPLPIPADAPTGAELQAFLGNVVMTDIEGAIASLEDIAETFNTVWIDPFSGAAAESDYGDVLALRAALKGATALIMILNAQNLDVDIDAEVNRPENLVEDYLLRNEAFFTPIAESVLMQSAKDTLIEAAADVLSAIDRITAETDPQGDDWINLGDSTSDEIEEAKVVITTARNALRDGTNYTFVPDNPEYQPTVIDPAEFFSGLDFRSFLPPFGGDKPQGFLPDPTFGGVLVQYEGDDPATLNEDVDDSETADIFEKYPEIDFVWHNEYSNEIIIAWDGSSNAVYYEFCWANESGAGDCIVLPREANEYALGVLENGQYYYFVVAAVTASDAYLMSEPAFVYVPETTVMPY